MTDAQAAKARQVGGVFATVAVVIGVPIAVLVTGLVFWLVSLPFDAKWRIADSMMVATYAAFPRIFSFVAAALIAAFSDPATLTSPYVISPGPAHFVAPGSVPAALLALLGRLDVFTIWATILLGLGLHIAGKVPKGRAFAAAAVMWVLGSLPLIYQGMKLG